MMEIRHKNRLKERGCIKNDMPLSVGRIGLMKNSCIHQSSSVVRVFNGLYEIMKDSYEISQ